jgi:hypothetical protein
MPDGNLLPLELAESLRQQGGVAIVVGLPSYNNVGTIEGVVAAIRQGLAAAFPGLSALIVNTDSGSTDGTPQRLAAMAETDGARLYQALLPVQDLDMPYHGIPGKADGMLLILRITHQLGARACFMLSPDLAALPPEWLDRLGRPVLEHGFDFAVPIYARHKFDGSITNGVVRPLVRTLYGRHMRQPMGSECAFSATLAERFLAQGVWSSDLARFGVDIWTTTQAISGGFRVCQVHCGPKVQAGGGASVDLKTTLTQVLGALFEDMTRNAAVWQRVRGAQPIPIFGAPGEAAPSAVTIDGRKLVESFRLGFRNLYELWSLVLAPATLLDLKRLAAAAPETFAIPDETWCRVVFDFALGYRTRTLNRSHLLGAFLPLYLGWLASYVREMQDATHADSERRLEQLCQVYEAQKAYLISRWRSPDRFNP